MWSHAVSPQNADESAENLGETGVTRLLPLFIVLGVVLVSVSQRTTYRVAISYFIASIYSTIINDRI